MISEAPHFPVDMSLKVKKEIELEIAHVLFVDIVAYSKLSVNEQHALIEELNAIVRSSEQFRKAETASRLLKIATGDGMALVFYKSPEEIRTCRASSRRFRNIAPMCVGRQWRSRCWWWPCSPLGFSLFCAKDRLVRSPPPWKKASRSFRLKI